MAEIKLQVQGLDRFLSSLKKAPSVVIDVAHEVIQRIGIQIQTLGRQEAPRDTGLLANQIQYASLGLVKAEVISKAEHSYDVHEGQPRNTKIVDTKPLERWADRHGIDNSYLLIRHIERHGTRPNPFFERALKQAEHFIESHVNTGADLMAERLVR